MKLVCRLVLFGLVATICFLYCGYGVGLAADKDRLARIPGTDLGLAPEFDFTGQPQSAP